MNLEKKIMIAGGVVFAIGLYTTTDGIIRIENNEPFNNLTYAKAVGGMVTSYIGAATSMISYFHDRYKSAINKN